eukprot:gnl/TRDRNA2_/TRDRNA2_173224_c0_seq2.p1 gnl/TRDRNA2_/TRDRNA2_173224_c0~~gnl/TRDRNA2_/TRDRNA2_173224_c0_seq2.p1  ORF type:complete len:358 (-),score=41.71 gnl/TRDRNA2_/TRDRNA2_173224_c0_seq2:14-1087(-)
MRLRHVPLMDAISSAALRRSSDFLRQEQQEAYAMLWALWRIGEPHSMLLEFTDSVLSCGLADPLVCGMLLSVDAWNHHADAALCLESAMSATLLHGHLANVVSCIGPQRLPPSSASRVQSEESPFHRRLARLLDITAGRAGSPDEILSRIESFGSVCSWLKIAGETKAAVLADAIDRRLPGTGECTLEFGAFVGYSAIRFAQQVSRRRHDECILITGVSLEIDPIHVAISRHHLDCAGLSTAGEVWVGQLQDTMPRVLEAIGATSTAFVFMDQRGTTFHEDLQQLELLAAMAPVAHVSADNTLKPGAPEFLWHVAIGALTSFNTGLWTMSEFALETIEDWQAVSLTLGSSKHFYYEC